MFTPKKVDFRQYANGIRIIAEHAKPLALELALVLPRDADERERAALQRADHVADGILDILSERDRAVPPNLKRPLNAHLNAWSAMNESLGAAARVSSESGERATALQTSFFPEGILFAKSEARAAWSEGNRRIRRLEAEGLRAEVEAMVGADIMNDVYKATEKLGKALGLDRVRETPSSTALQAQLQRFSHAVGRYGRILAANADEEDVASIDRFLSAVAPIDAYRSRALREEEIDATEETDAPVIVPSGPTTEPAPQPAPTE